MSFCRRMAPRALIFFNSSFPFGSSRLQTSARIHARTHARTRTHPSQKRPTERSRPAEWVTWKAQMAKASRALGSTPPPDEHPGAPAPGAGDSSAARIEGTAVPLLVVAATAALVPSSIPPEREEEEEGRSRRSLNAL